MINKMITLVSESMKRSTIIAIIVMCFCGSTYSDFTINVERTDWMIMQKKKFSMEYDEISTKVKESKIKLKSCTFSFNQATINGEEYNGIHVQVTVVVHNANDKLFDIVIHSTEKVMRAGSIQTVRLNFVPDSVVSNEIMRSVYLDHWDEYRTNNNGSNQELERTEKTPAD